MGNGLLCRGLQKQSQQTQDRHFRVKDAQHMSNFETLLHLHNPAPSTDRALCARSCRYSSTAPKPYIDDLHPASLGLCKCCGKNLYSPVVWACANIFRQSYGKSLPISETSFAMHIIHTGFRCRRCVRVSEQTNTAPGRVSSHFRRVIKASSRPASTRNLGLHHATKKVSELRPSSTHARR